MREMTISGYVVAPPEMRSNDRGNYWTFRVGNHEYGDGENDTRWFTVHVGQDMGILRHLKKGSHVKVVGDYRDKIYHSEKYGAQIDRTVSAWNVKFSDGGRRDDARETVPATKATAQTKAQSSVTVGEDELPF